MKIGIHTIDIDIYNTKSILTYDIFYILIYIIICMILTLSAFFGQVVTLSGIARLRNGYLFKLMFDDFHCIFPLIK